MFLLYAKDLRKEYGDRTVVTLKSLQIRPGDKIGVVGKNGAGKSTLLRAMLDSYRVYRVPKARIGYFAQDHAQLEPGRTVLENVSGTAVQNLSVTRTVIANLGLNDCVYKKVAVLSGGEKGKTALAKLIVSDCNVLLLDEPTNYLDLPSVLQVRAALQAYEGTVVFVSHDPAFIRDTADIVLTVGNGKIVVKTPEYASF